ncbi:MAG: Do family serine endopeptidase, partial [Bacteroidia bacterium]|nr:Do family serine endopeptidase [Bacteroidia bacterium]
LVVSLLVLIGFRIFEGDGNVVRIEHIDDTPSRNAVFTVNESGEVVPLDFTETARRVRNAVVSIQATQMISGQGNQAVPDQYQEFFGDEFFERFFGPNAQRGPQQPQPRVGSGSGVIINNNGYIVTNNHVVASASELRVTLLDNRTFNATVVGTDPTTDLALIKINANDLPTVPFVNSDEVAIGQWVLAIGNPYNLNSTVTAGIISATGRSINILNEQYAVESFIQTDAAINPGNSGGALVNLQGGLVGINTAIASPTGSYSGYGFAVPANLVKKVVQDLIEYGKVQRGYLGVMIRGVTSDLAQEQNLNITQGVYVDSLLANSAAREAGIRSGDVIIALDGQEINTAAELQEIVATRRPGDELRVRVNRQGNERDFTVTLNNVEGTTQITRAPRKATTGNLGANFETLNAQTARQLNIPGGVRVTQLYPGKISRQTTMQSGFIIIRVDEQVVRNVEELTALLRNKQGGVMLEGIYPNSPKDKVYYAVGL